jgi:hypothetical protein
MNPESFEYAAQNLCDETLNFRHAKRSLEDAERDLKRLVDEKADLEFVLKTLAEAPGVVVRNQWGVVDSESVQKCNRLIAAAKTQVWTSRESVCLAERRLLNASLAMTDARRLRDLQNKFSVEIHPDVPDLFSWSMIPRDSK